MGWIANLRRLWRAHDEKLAEHAPPHQHGGEEVAMPIGPYGVEGEVVSPNESGEFILGDAIRDEEAWEHEEPH